MHRMESGGWPYSEVGRDSSETPSLRAAVLHAAVFHLLHRNRNRRACIDCYAPPTVHYPGNDYHCIVLQCSIRNVRCSETRESVSREFFLYSNIGKSIHAWSCVCYNV